ncbi:MAG: integrin alpha [Thermodesulfobacteriota bacterium]|nr:integrin alpha [Thermodesulfobacteriota bacterium]
MRLQKCIISMVCLVSFFSLHVEALGSTQQPSDAASAQMKGRRTLEALGRNPGDSVTSKSSSTNTQKDAPWRLKVLDGIRDQEYHITRYEKDDGEGIGDVYQACNRTCNLRAYFTSKGTRIINRTDAPSAWSAGFALMGIAREKVIRPLPEDKRPTIDGSRIEYKRGFVTEWYENSDQGLEQGFTIHKKVAGRGPLYICLLTHGNLTPVIVGDGRTVDFLTSAGAITLRYDGLKAFDSEGRVLPSNFELAGPTLKIMVDDTLALYPILVDPLLTTPTWTAEANQPNSGFGYSVCTAGDVNGDGYDDVIIGARKYDNGETDEGMVFLYYGSAQGLSVTADWTAEGDQVEAEFGYSVCTAGDVNGDGYDDVIVGARKYDNGEADEGMVFLYYGSVQGLSTAADWTAEGDQAEAEFGYSVCTAGDVNGDGYDDVIVGARKYDNGEADEGMVFLYYGSVQGLPVTADWAAEGDQAEAGFGVSVSTAGDVNGDGFDDVIVGARGYDNGQTDEGMVFVYYGSAQGLSINADWTAEGDQAVAYFGRSVSAAGDVNGDGYDDVIVGAYKYDGGHTNEGKVFVYHGSGGGLSDEEDWSAEGNQSSAYFGFSVSSAGDVDVDGFDDVIVGAPGYDNGEPDEGIVFFYGGSSQGLSPVADWTSEGNQAGAEFGFSVSSAGDINNDLYDEVIIGSQRYGQGEIDEGVAFMYTVNRRPTRPTAVTPVDEAVVAGGTVTLRASAYADPEDDTHIMSHWRVRRSDQIALFYEVSSSADLTEHTVTGLDDGFKYLWQVGYEDSANNVSWSEEYTFKMGISEQGTIPPISPGTGIGDFTMVSFVHWPDDPAAPNVFGIAYDPMYFRIGTYDPVMEAYIEYNNDLKVEPGRAYWVLARDGLEFTYQGVQVNLFNDVYVSLSYNADTGNGWNMIACPNGRDYSWNNLEVVEYDKDGNTLFGPAVISALPDQNDYLDKQLWRWEDGSYHSDTSAMTRNQGYWVKAMRANLYIKFPGDTARHSTTPPDARDPFLSETTGQERRLDPETSDAVNDSGESPPQPIGGLLTDSNGEVSSSMNCFISEAAFGSSLRSRDKTPGQSRRRFFHANTWSRILWELYEVVFLPSVDSMEKR